MTKRLKKFFKKSLPRKKWKKLRSSDKRKIPNKLKNNYISETKSKTTKLTSNYHQIEHLEIKEEEKSFDELDIIENDLDEESQNLNFPNASVINTNDPMI